MCESGQSTVATALKTEVFAEEVFERHKDTVQGLFSAATRVKTMFTRPAIKWSFITPRLVVVDNF